MELYYLVYTSTPAKLLDDTKLLELLNTAREANNRFDITGMLVCLPDSYIQLIEGPKPHVEQLYHNIQLDQRHLRVTTLRQGPISRRFFPDWAMAFEKRDSTLEDNHILNLQNNKVMHLFDIIEH